MSGFRLSPLLILLNLGAEGLGLLKWVFFLFLRELSPFLPVSEIGGEGRNIEPLTRGLVGLFFLATLFLEKAAGLGSMS